jgi:prophage maintenance system killer protein
MNMNKKDIIAINQEIGESGELQNPGSLEFALSIIKQQRSWLYELSYLVRSMLVDHAFVDGNKRTSLALILLYLKEQGIEYDRQKIVLKVYNISKKNIKDINKIMRLIKNGISC